MTNTIPQLCISSPLLGVWRVFALLLLLASWGCGEIGLGVEPDRSSQSQGCDTDDNGYDDIPCPGRAKVRSGALKGSSSACPATFNLTECFYAQGLLIMGDDPVAIDQDDFDNLLLAIAYDLEGRTHADLLSVSIYYDTPFYNHGVFGAFEWPGTGCLGTNCYLRAEINYVAQGELWAAYGLTLEEGHKKMETWKKLPILHAPTKPSSGTYSMFDLGYDFYKSFIAK